MKIKKLMSILGIFILIGVDVYAGGLSGVSSKITSVRTDLLDIMKVLAGLGLLLIIGSYVVSTAENKTFPWKWVIGALTIGAFAQILAMFGLK